LPFFSGKIVRESNAYPLNWMKFEKKERKAFGKEYLHLAKQSASPVGQQQRSIINLNPKSKSAANSRLLAPFCRMPPRSPAPRAQPCNRARVPAGGGRRGLVVTCGSIPLMRQ